jgi:hypothetical protein
VKKWNNLSKTSEGDNTREYNVWLHMINRCNLGSRSQQVNSTYVGCEVTDEWRNYDNFHGWLMSNKYFNMRCANGHWYQLDKDLKIRGNKLYSPETCLFIPRSINTFLTKRNKLRGEYLIGVYKYANKYRAMISNPLTGKNEHIGLFESEIDAFNAYKDRKENISRVLAINLKEYICSITYDSLLNYKVEISD